MTQTELNQIAIQVDSIIRSTPVWHEPTDHPTGDEPTRDILIQTSPGNDYMTGWYAGDGEYFIFGCDQDGAQDVMGAIKRTENEIYGWLDFPRPQ